MDAALASKLRGQFSPEEKYLVGVSGGRDSMALWHFLREAGYHQLVICHLNHQLRGSESEKDAGLVRETAEVWGGDRQTAVAIAGEDVRALAKARKLSTETAARQARHAFFARIARAQACSNVFLAHHADDQVETVLINLCRGSGARGLGGMPEVSDITVDGTPLRLIRPLLDVWREEIDAYVRRHGIAFREDATNAETAGSARNRIRHELIPLMGEIFDRDVRQAIRRSSRTTADDDRALETILDDMWPRLISEGGEKKAAGLDVANMIALDEGWQRRAIHCWLRNAPGLPACGFRQVESIRTILSPREKTAKINLPGGWHVRRKDGRIFLQPPRGGALSE